MPTFAAVPSANVPATGGPAAGPVDLPIENTRPAPASGSNLSLADAVRSALSWHPSIDEAVARVNQSKALIDVARAGYYPTIRAGVDSSYANTGRAGWQPRLSASASQMIYDFGKVSGAVDAKTANAEVTRAQLLLGVDVVIRDTANALIEVQRYQSLLRAAETQVRGVQVIAALVHRRTDQGASTRSDKVQADARVEAARSTVLELKAQVQRWQSVLANLIGQNGAVRVSANVPDWLSKACEVVEPEWRSVPSVLVAEHQRDLAAAELNQSRAQAFPTLSLDATAGYDVLQRGASTDQSGLKVGLNLSGSIFDGGATAASMTAAQHDLNAADAAIRNSRLQASTSLMEARAQTSSLRSLLGTLASRSGMLSETRDLYSQQYIELGTRTLLDLLNAEQELHQAAFDEANTIHDLRRLGIDCMFNSGRSRALFSVGGMTIRGMKL